MASTNMDLVMPIFIALCILGFFFTYYLKYALSTMATLTRPDRTDFD